MVLKIFNVKHVELDIILKLLGKKQDLAPSVLILKVAILIVLMIKDKMIKVKILL